jgi:deoxyribonuclease-4
MKQKRKVGAHLSIKGGIYTAVERAQLLKINTLQIFLKNANRWKGKDYTDEDIELFKSALAGYGTLDVFAHSGYLINLAGEGENHEKSIKALIDEIERAEKLDIPCIVIHPGSHKEKGIDFGIRKIAESIDLIYETHPNNLKLLLETTSGMGSSVGHKFEHIRDIIDKTSRRENLGVCIDTCHIFAAGYDISQKDSSKEVIDTFDSIIGLDLLKLIHINDSKKECGSLIDRHAHIGDGFIGTEGFSYFLNDKRIKSIPLVLETPKKMEGVSDNPDDMKADMENLSRIYDILL